MRRGIVNVTTWNVLLAPYDRHRRMDLIARDLAGTDVALLQEVVYLPDGSGSAEEIAEACGMQVASSVTKQWDRDPSVRVGTAVLSRLPVVSGEPVSAPCALPMSGDGPFEYSQYAAATLRLPSRRRLTVVSLHLPWGGDKEPRRAAHVRDVEAALWERDPGDRGDVTVMGGDLNTLPDSDTLRYLTGLGTLDGHGSFWVDAWAAAGEGPGYTQDPAAGNVNIDQTARARGILDPTLLPRRRIDYLLVRGWAYGQAGCPVSARLIGTVPSPAGLHPSDHYGVSVDLLDPPL